jgi:hypothetical protein
MWRVRRTWAVWVRASQEQGEPKQDESRRENAFATWTWTWSAIASASASQRDQMEEQEAGSNGAE